jgi:cob(I)alamin adenosyltransferase
MTTSYGPEFPDDPTISETEQPSDALQQTLANVQEIATLIGEDLARLEHEAKEVDNLHKWLKNQIGTLRNQKAAAESFIFHLQGGKYGNSVVDPAALAQREAEQAALDAIDQIPD